MSVVISYLDYQITPSVMPIEKFVDSLSDEYIVNWSVTYMGKEIRKREFVSQILKNMNKIQMIAIGTGDSESESAMFSKFLIPYFETKGGTDVDYIIYNRGELVSSERNIPYFIHKEFNLTRTQIFQIEQSCTSTLLSINLAKALIAGGSAKRILSLSGNILGPLEEKRLMGLFCVSDGIAAVEISSSDVAMGTAQWEVIDFLGFTDGSISTVADMFKNGEHIVNKGIELIRNIMLRNNLDVNDLTFIVPQNTNFSGWNYYCENLGMGVEKVFTDNFGSCGHIGDVDTIRNLQDITRSEKVRKGGYVLSYGIGTGASWNALLLRKL